MPDRGGPGIGLLFEGPSGIINAAAASRLRRCESSPACGGEGLYPFSTGSPQDAASPGEAAGGNALIEEVCRMVIRDLVGSWKRPGVPHPGGNLRAVCETLEPRVLLAGDGTVNYHAVLVGISEYASHISDLQYGDDDARDLRDALLASAAWNESNLRLLVDDIATKSAIRAAFDDAADVLDEDDVFVFSFAGHGGPESDAPPEDEADGLDEALYDYDMTPIRDDELAEWLAALPTANYVVILDACNSGGMIQGAGGVFLTAAAETERSYESGELENGILTYFLVEGMTRTDRPIPADTNADGFLSAEELYAYASPMVVGFKPEQHPQIYDGHEGDLNFLPLRFGPVADPAGPYIVSVGGLLALDAGASTAGDYEITSYAWDLDDDGAFETDAAGSAVFHVSYDFLASLGLTAGGPYRIHLRVTDSGRQSQTARTTLTIVVLPGDTNLASRVNDAWNGSSDDPPPGGAGGRPAGATRIGEITGPAFRPSQFYGLGALAASDGAARGGGRVVAAENMPGHGRGHGARKINADSGLLPVGLPDFSRESMPPAMARADALGAVEPMAGNASLGDAGGRRQRADSPSSTAGSNPARPGGLDLDKEIVDLLSPLRIRAL